MRLRRDLGYLGDAVVAEVLRPLTDRLTHKHNALSRRKSTLRAPWEVPNGLRQRSFEVSGHFARIEILVLTAEPVEHQL